MKLHTLTLRGVGPFRDQFTINFDDIDGNGLFLIDGDTGTGKSTIIDAIVYAIFGVTTDKTGDDRMVSDFLPQPITKSGRPFVELLFTVESGVYRVRREPKFQYHNRNDKLAEQNPTLRLERLPNETADHGELVSASLQEGNSEISQIVQLSRDQFLATVVLAQGQFARFLRAAPDERGDILQRIFGTGAYKDIEGKLKEWKSEAIKAKGEALKKCREAATRFHQEAEVEVSGEEWLDLAAQDPAEMLRISTDRVHEIANQLTATRQQQAAAQLAKTAADQVLQAAKEQEKLVQRKRELLTRQQKLSEAEPRIAAHHETLERHGKAVAVQPAAQARQHAQAELDQAHKGVHSAQQQLDQADVALANSKSADAVAVIDESVGQLATKVGKLTAAIDTEKSIPEQQQALAATLKRVAELTELVAQVKQQLEILPAQRQELETTQTTLIGLSATLDGHSSQLKRDQEGLEASQAAVTLTKQHATAEQEYQGAVTALDQATSHAYRVEQTYHAGIAGILAQELQPGEPCLVCGGTEHPHPAEQSEDSVTREQLEAARADVDNLRTKAQTARERVEELRHELNSAVQTAENQPIAFWEARVKSAADQVAAAENAQQELPDINQALVDLAEHQHALESDLDSQTSKLITAKTDGEHQKANLAKDLEEVSAARDDFETVAARVGWLVARQEALRNLRDALTQQDSAARGLHQAEQFLDEQLNKNGFSTEADLGAALLAADEEKQLRDAVQKHQADRALVTGQLANAELADVNEKATIDLATPEHTATQAADALRLANGALTLAEQQSQESGKLLNELRKAATHLERTAAEVTPIIRMADMVNGGEGNLRNVPLSQYVVLRRFAEVVDAANARLVTMSDGRYRLEQDVTEQKGRNKRRGLGLRIVDERTDAPRSVTTLSGGETFYTSLSLALGLADVVQQEAGGIQMGTLFVDEGFGSLDTETLDAVMSVLNTLSAGNRTVGVISHVTEMKQTIPYRLHVRRPNPDGPSVITIPQ